MAKRLTDSEKWKDEWFFELSNELKLFWIYLLDNCDHAGIWKPNKGLANSMLRVSIEFDKVLENELKDRVILLEDGKWFIPKFLKFQYPNGLSDQSKAQNSVIKRLFDSNCLERVKKELGNPFIRVQDKDKDKDKDKKGGVGGNKFGRPMPGNIYRYADGSERTPSFNELKEAGII